MPINPQAKLDAIARRKAYLNKRAVKRKHKRGTLSKAETSAVALVAKEHPTPKQIEGLATALNRSEETIKSVMARARETFQRNAKEYVDIHMKSARSDDPDVARKAAQWAIEHMSSRDKDGNVERIIEPSATNESAPNIHIGIALGGLPARLPSTVDGEIEEV